MNTQKRKLDLIEDTLVETYKELEDVKEDIRGIEAPHLMKTRKKRIAKKISGKRASTLSQLYAKQEDLQKRAEELQDCSSGRILSPPPLRPVAGPSTSIIPPLPSEQPQRSIEEMSTALRNAPVSTVVLIRVS